MSVLIVTSVGDIVVDLHADRCPLTTKNFLKLCKMKYYNGCLFHRIEKDFTAQTGDRTGTGAGGDSVYKFLYGDQARFFDDEIHPDLKHSKMGTVAMASAGENCNASQFYFTLRDDLDYLDGKHTIFGVVEEKEGLETLAKISEAYVDDEGRPFKDIRIKHTYILDDPFEDPPQLAEFIPENSPEGKPHDEIAEERLEDNWVPLDETLGPAELEEVIRVKEAHTNAVILEGIGDIPDADIKPPENVLFVCKLNPVTQDEDLFTIFSRFGTVVSADIIRDYKTGDSLCYAFIEFETKEACERAYFKMDNTLIDDRRIHVDFSQSVSKLWGQYRHGKGTNTNQGGCFKCGSTDHIAKNCDQDTINKQNAPKYLLKDDTRDGDERQRYEMVFDADDLGDVGGQERAKKRRVYHGRSGLSTQRSSDKKSSDRHRHNFDGRRGSREPEWSEGSKSGAEHHGSKRVESRAEERYDDREHRKRREVSRERDHGGYRSNSSKSRENEGLDNDRRRRDEGDYGRREDRDSQRRDAGNSEKKSKYSEDQRHRDHRNNGHYEKRSKDHDDASYSERKHRDHGRK